MSTYIVGQFPQPIIASQIAPLFHIGIHYYGCLRLHITSQWRFLHLFLLLRQLLQVLSCSLYQWRNLLKALAIHELENGRNLPILAESTNNNVFPGVLLFIL
jgi:hypothetical protein